jgi:hypothetical protein
MANEVPLVRHFIACREIVVHPGYREVTLENVIHVVFPLPGEPFPCILDPMALYALVTSGRGEHDIAVELAFLDQGVERTLRQSNPRRVDLGQDPTVVQGLPIPLKIRFDRPGQYTFYLLSDGKRIAEEHVEVRSA